MCQPGKREYEIVAEIVHEFRLHNADLSYLPIVGGGANSCILHYRENDATAQDGDLLLIDAGCEVDCYASDITRTFPVNGRFSTEQRALYDIVLEANYAAIERVKPGNHWNEPHEAAVRVITQGLVQARPAEGPRWRSWRSPARIASFSCIAPVTGSAWTCTMSATTRSATSGACSSPAWR